MDPRPFVGRTSQPTRVSWSSDDTILYALAVGAGRDPDLDELTLTLERSSRGGLRALPSMAAALSLRAGSVLRSIDWGGKAVVHARQEVVLERTLPAEGSVELQNTLTDVFDTGKGAIVVTTTEATDAGDGQRLFTSTSQAYVIGAGGFGGEPPPKRPGAPERVADLTLELPTSPEQALLYRLTGDRNPLHADPEAARRMGFPRPILHGLATWGSAVRLLLHHLDGSRLEDVRALEGRFSGTVVPGDRLVVTAWHDDDRVAFEVTGEGGPVLTEGSLTLERSV